MFGWQMEKFMFFLNARSLMDLTIWDQLVLTNKELVQQYLDTMKYIPHIERTVSMVPTTGLLTKQ